MAMRLSSVKGLRTDRQAWYLMSLMFDDEFSEREADDTFAWVASDRCTVHSCSRAIGRAEDRIDAARKAKWMVG